MVWQSSEVMPMNVPDKGDSYMDREMYTRLLNLLKNGRNVVLMTRFFGEHGDLEDMEKKIIERVPFEGIPLKALEQGLPVTYKEADTTVLLEPFYPEERLIILGGGHIALPLTDFGARIGFSVTVVDDRPSFANRPRFPAASQVICSGFEETIQQLHITESDYVVIITRGHRHDQDCLSQLLRGTEPFYTGMIGSRRRVAAVKDELTGQGYDARRLQRVHSPIGLSIGAITPEEIAVSITAELIACKRLKSEASAGADRYTNRSDIDMEVLRALSDETKEPKSIVTIISSKGSVPRGAGAKMLVYPYGKIVGSIGGGCSEGAVINDARRIIGTGGYLLKTVDMTGEAAEDEGMVCGGIMQVLIEDY